MCTSMLPFGDRTFPADIDALDAIHVWVTSGLPGPAISNRGWCTCFRGKILGSFRFSDALTGSCHGSRDDYFRDAVCTYGHNTMGCSLARREGSDEWTLHVVQRELTVMSPYPGCGQGSGG